MDQLAYSFIALNVDGQQRLPFQPRSAVDTHYNIPLNAFNTPPNTPISGAAASEYLRKYTVAKYEPFALAPHAAAWTHSVPAADVTSNCQPATQPANQQMDLEEDEEMLPAAAAATPAKSQTPVRRSERLANKPRLNYKQAVIYE
jgi:hypothetical protein